MKNIGWWLLGGGVAAGAYWYFTKDSGKQENVKIPPNIKTKAGAPPPLPSSSGKISKLRGSSPVAAYLRSAQNAQNQAIEAAKQAAASGSSGSSGSSSGGPGCSFNIVSQSASDVLVTLGIAAASGDVQGAVQSVIDQTMNALTSCLQLAKSADEAVGKVNDAIRFFKTVSTGAALVPGIDASITATLDQAAVQVRDAACAAFPNICDLLVSA